MYHKSSQFDSILPSVSLKLFVIRPLRENVPLLVSLLYSLKLLLKLEMYFLWLNLATAAGTVPVRWLCGTVIIAHKSAAPGEPYHAILPFIINGLIKSISRNSGHISSQTSKKQKWINYLNKYNYAFLLIYCYAKKKKKKGNILSNIV